MMSGPGAALRGHSAELLQELAELRARRRELSGRIREEEAERSRLQRQIGALTERLLRASESLARHLALRGQLDGLIAETEAAHGQMRLELVTQLTSRPEILEALPDDLRTEVGHARKASEP